MSYTPDPSAELVVPHAEGVRSLSCQASQGCQFGDGTACLPVDLGGVLRHHLKVIADRPYKKEIHSDLDHDPIYVVYR